MIKGTLKMWNSEKGFGFIKVMDSSSDVFVHISAFPNYPRSPEVGDSIQFDTETKDGKTRAIQCRIEGLKPVIELVPIAKPVHKPKQVANAHRQGRDARPKKQTPRRQGRTALGGKIRMVAIIVMVAIGASQYLLSLTSGTQDTLPSATHSNPSASNHLDERFSCDGRQYCSQMRSYEEALFFLNSCPDVKMDGDGDGIPCERQFDPQ